MIELLEKYLGKTLPQFVRMLEHPEYVEERTINFNGDVTTTQVDEVFAMIKMDKTLYWKQLLTFLFKEPRELIYLATQHSKCVPSSDPDKVKIAMLVEKLAANIDEFTKKVGHSGIWGKVYRGPVDVVEVWRTRDDTIVGEPVERKIGVRDIQSRLVAMAVMERSPGNETVCLSLSDGRYRDDSRCDHLLEVPPMFSLMGEKALDLFKHSVPVMHNLIDLATILQASGKIELGPKRTALYKLGEIYVKRELKPEDVPDALYDIGSWS